jgi:flavin-dependent dehydrogenase
VGRHGAGRRVEIRAPLTIGADGARSTVARLVGAPTVHRSRHASAMVMGWWSGVEADGYQWLYAPGAAAGIIPTNDGQVCVWAGTPARDFPTQRRLPELGLREVLGRVAPDWAERLARGRREGPVRGFPGIPGFARQPAGPGWALVGDAGYFKDPLSTHGMTDALRDAELLASAVIRGRESGAPPGTVPDDYADTRERLSHDLRDTVDRVASYDWTMAELRELLVRMSQAMRPEVDHLSGLGTMAEVGR